jgi:hypothetical protein
MMSVDNNGIDHRLSLVAQLTSIGNGLTHHQFETLVLAGQILELPRPKLSEVAREQSFTGLYRLIEEKNPQTAASIIYQLLIRVGFPRPKLDGLKQFISDDFDHICSNKELDLMLTISFILGNMNETCYSTFKEVARRTFLAEYAPDRITSPIHLIELLMGRDSLLLKYLYAWLDISGASLYHRNLKQFCERQGLPEPNWSTLINNQGYENIQLLDFSESNFVMVQNPIILTKLKCKDLKRYTYLPCLVILIVLLPVLFGCMTLFGYEFSQKNATNATYYVGSNTTAKLACYDSNEIQSVIITPNDDTSKGAIMYATQDEPSTVDVLLPSEVIWPSPPRKNNKRIDGSAQLLTINYYNKKKYLTYAAEGVITYTVKLNYIPVNPTECPFRIYVFNSVHDYDLFFAAVSNGEDTNHIPHTNTSCFRDNGTYILNFTLNDDFYLFVMRPVENILVGINASANLTHYVMPSNAKGSCTLNKQCTFNFTFQAINSKWCIYGSSDNLSQSEVNVTSIAISWTLLIKFSLSIGIFVFAVCLFTLLMMVTCISVHLMKQYRAVHVYDIIN